MSHLLRKKRILITGGAGFIGSHVAKKLARYNTVYLVGRHTPSSDVPGIFTRIDVRRKSFITFIKKGHFDYIFHFAGNADQQRALVDPLYDCEENLLSTLRILECIRTLSRKPKFLLASSVTVYGHCQDARLSENTSIPMPLSNYGVSKLAAERYLYAYAHQYQIPALTFRFFSTYGPGMRRLMIYDFIHKLSKDPEHLEIFGGGSEARDLTYIDDQVANIIQIAEKADYRGETYNMGSGRAYTTRQVALHVARSLGVKPHFSFTGRARIFDAHRWVADVNRIKELGCTAPTNIKEGIKKTVQWFKCL